MDLVPLFSRIIVRRKVQEMTRGGLIVPKAALEGTMKATEGEVISVGSEVTDVVAGDSVFFGKYSGAEIERDGEKYVVMNEEDVIAKVKMA
jgi:chaperonin GroES